MPRYSRSVREFNRISDYHRGQRTERILAQQEADRKEAAARGPSRPIDFIPRTQVASARKLVLRREKELKEKDSASTTTVKSK
ncbi:hypothetical protein CBOM_05634 [Ceraceosorus bombacis]|uniref:Uncharacterized protein n=1 Tax=Ceraceosorus bombacis TaxID=401625 RepID=A0A0P1BRZ6_9BASI|nr:hypothetical protein CBOM_05634 [Ceraceosorus bombacis]